MKLFYANTSPYARKVRIALLEKGLADRIEMVFANPFDDNPSLKAANPLGKVPALLLDDGSAVFDSTVICAWLDSAGTGPALLPDGPAQWRIRTGEALGNGMLDALFAIVMERRRPEAEQSESWLGRWTDAVLRSADAVEAGLQDFQGDISMAQIALASALGYADFRLPDIDWRTGRPRLSDWHASFAKRQSYINTTPPAS